MFPINTVTTIKKLGIHTNLCEGKESCQGLRGCSGQDAGLLELAPDAAAGGRDTARGGALLGTHQSFHFLGGGGHEG